MGGVRTNHSGYCMVFDLDRAETMKKKFNYMHVICIAITLGLLVCTAFVFPKSVLRAIESFRDFGLSVAYYFLEVLGIEHEIVVTVIELPNNLETPPAFMPETYIGFKENAEKYLGLWTSKENFAEFLDMFAVKMSDFSQILLLVLPVIVGVIVLLKRSFEKQNNRYNTDTKPLKVFKKVVKFTYTPIKSWVNSFFRFIKDTKWYYVGWLCIWALNFNVFTVVIEFIAFYLYFVISFDVGNIYKQLYKLVLDLSVPIRFIPVFVWVIIAIYIRCYLRKRIAFRRLRHMELRNRGFINERPISVMVCGTMGKCKTTMITDMILSQEDMFRDKAKEKLLEWDLKFPNFPWINLENAMKVTMKRHLVYNLATTKRFIQHLKGLYLNSLRYPKYRMSMLRHLRKKYGIRYGNFLFDYDYEKYGLGFDDKLKVVNVWEVIMTYAELYFIYASQTSLMLSNYSIRTDSLLMSVGNFPLWNGDFFSRDSRVIDGISQHAHILDFDCLRLGRKVLENNGYADSFEFGVVGITEIGKERGNTIELADKKKNDLVTNQKNDLFNYSLKMIRHSATVDNFPFVKVITDEQRPESLGADARDLCDIVHIKERGDENLSMPFFAVEELLHEFVFSRFSGMYQDYRFNRSDNTLLMYLIKGVCARIHNYYKGIYNRFGYSTLKVQTENGTQDGRLKKGKYFLMNKKIYSKRFSTDCFSDFFDRKTLRSKVGINDLPMYLTEKANMDELKAQNSYFIIDIQKYM